MRARSVILCLLLAGCGAKQTTEPKGAETEKPAPGAEVARQAKPDPGPQLMRKIGSAEAKDVGSIAVTALARHDAEDGHSYFAFAGDREYLGAFTTFAVEGVPYAVAAPSVVEGERRVVVRVPGSLPDTVRLRWSDGRDVQSRYGFTPGIRGSIEVAGLTNAPAKPELEPEFLKSLSDAFDSRTRFGDAFGRFAAARLHAMSSSTSGGLPGPTGRWWMEQRTDLVQLMDLYTGMRSVEEALQVDRALWIRPDPQGIERTIDLATIPGVPLKEHPWDQMIKELGKEPVIEPLASYVPADMLYIHMHDLRTFVKLAGELDDWVSPVSQALESRPGASHFTGAYERQLILERTGVAELLGHVAAHEVALVSSDPFLREGTDVSMIFRVANRATLVTALDGFLASAMRRRPDVKRVELKLDGFDATRYYTDDREIDQYRAEFGDVFIISNSAGALAHLHAAHAGKVQRQAELGDFRYMRAVYPYDKAAEDAFVFASDAFVARTVSPEVKILEARRVQARADLMALNSAALLYGHLEGQRAMDVETLLKANILRPQELVHDGGAKIEFDAESGAHSSWGRAAFLTPIRELEIGKISQAEKEAYEVFRDGYQQYWSRVIDPIAVRIDRAGGGARLSVDARMLPLIEGTEYDDLIELVGTSKVVAAPVQRGARWTFAVGREARLRVMLDGMSQAMIGSHDVGVGWLGDWVMVGVDDRSGLWDMAVGLGAMPALASDEPQADRLERGLTFLTRFPIYAGAHIKSPIALATVLTTLKKWVEDAAPGMVAWGQDEPYREIAIVKVAERPNEQSFGAPSIHYATVQGVFVIAFERAVLESQIDAILDGEVAKVSAGADAEADTQTRVQLDIDAQSWIRKVVLGFVEMVILDNHGQVVNSWSALSRGLPGAKLDSFSLRKFGVGFLGYEPRSPHGGTMSLGANGEVVHSIYGSAASPTIPDLPVAGSPFHDFMVRVSKLSAEIEFDGEGNHRGLHTKMSLETK